MSKIVKHVKSGFTGGHYAFQSEKSNKPFTNIMTECGMIKLRPDDVVADIGAYVGEYSIWASKQGVKKVLSYEATPETFQVLKMNQQPQMEVFNMAVCGDDSEFIDLYISSGIGVTNSIAKKGRKAGKVSVPAIRYEKALQNATVVKIDIEGAEYGLNIIQPQLRAMILEFHPIVGKPWKEMAEKIMSDVEAAGFKPLKRPTFANGWAMAGCWVKH